MSLARVAGVAAWLALACSGGGSGPARNAPPTDAPRQVNPIVGENAHTGANEWRLHHHAHAHQIEGYALLQSAAPGEDVAIAVSVQPAPARFIWILYRLGYYGRVGAREITRGGPLPASPQPRCPPAPGTGLVACSWPPTFTLSTSSAWVTGLYAVRLVREDGWDAWVPLVLRASEDVAPVLIVIPTATWQAYNDWGGTSLYDDHVGVTSSGRAFQVSYDRPYAQDFGAGHLLRWDYRLAEWIEAQGEDVDYVTDEDVDRDPSLVARARAVVLSAHDEYWTVGVRNALEAAVAGGTSLLLFGANAGFWQVRYGPAADGRDRRVITCYKGDARLRDPVGPESPELTVQFRQPPVSRPESALFGVMFSAWNAFGFPLTVRDPSHWALTGTGLTQSDAIPLIGGYEVDDLGPPGEEPPGVEVIGDAAFLAIYGGVAHGRMVVRQQGQALVFAAGGIDFTSALAGDDRADPRVQRIAENVLAVALGRDLPDHVVVLNGPSPAPQGPFARQVATVAGAAFDPGSADGPRGVGRLRQPVAVAILPSGAAAVLDMGDGAVRRIDATGGLTTIPTPPLLTPTGLASDASGNLYVADTGHGCILRVDAAGASSVLAGACGAIGNADGSGAAARFMAPEGLAVSGAALLVADAGAGSVRRVDLAGAAHTVSTVGAPPLFRPTAVAAASDGTLYVVETGFARVVALAGGSLRVVAGGDQGYADGPGDRAKLLPQLGLALLPDHALAVADPGNGRVRVVRDGVVTTLAGSGVHGGRDGPGDQADLVLPAGLAVDAAGRLLVADIGTSTVRAITR
jgi:hypothetical protein